MTPEQEATVRTIEASVRARLPQTGAFFAMSVSHPDTDHDDPSARGLSFAGGFVLVADNGDLLLPHMGAHIPAANVADVLAKGEAAKDLSRMPTTTEPERT